TAARSARAQPPRPGRACSAWAGFVKARVEEAVRSTRTIVVELPLGTRKTREQVARCGGWVSGGVALKERWCLVAAFGTEHRTGGITEPAARAQQGPQGVAQRALRLRQGRDIAFAAQPAHVGVATHDARGGAGRVQQDGVERAAVPPGV